MVNHKITHHITSMGVCHNLSFKSGWSFFVMLRTLVMLVLISLIYCACFPDSNLTFIASYATNNEKPQDNAKKILSNPKWTRTIVVILETIAAWKDGNPHAENKLEIRNFLYFIESIIIFSSCVMSQTKNRINNGFILIQFLKYNCKLSCIKENTFS